MSAIDTRGLQRESLYFMAELQPDGTASPEKVKVRNLSDGGMMIDGSLMLDTGRRVTVTLKNIGTIPAHITYSVTEQGALTLGTDLTYQLVRTAGPACDATAVTGGMAVNSGEEFTLGVEATQSYCLEVTLSGDYGENLAESGAVTWRFDAAQQPG